MNSPTKASYEWVNWVKEKPFFSLLGRLFLYYFLFNFAFGTIYLATNALSPVGKTWMDYYYFSFVTALTIGYGDFLPEPFWAKFLVIVQSCISALYFAVMVAALSANMFFPKNTIHFSKKILLNLHDHLPGSPIEGFLGIRILNSHRERLVNPEIRISLTEHCHGNVIATIHSIVKNDEMPYLGRHDFTQFFSNIRIGTENRTISEEIEMSLEHDKNSSEKSRFRITISVSGNYGIQQIACYKKYYANDIEIGKTFESIRYNDADQKQNMRYTDFEDFWNDFNKIKKIF